jgi:uncharacterized membrane protein YfcA
VALPQRRPWSPIACCRAHANVGHALPSVAQALIFIAIVEVEPMTLVAMVGAAIAGAWIGASVVAGWSRRRVRLGMGWRSSPPRSSSCAS